MDQKLENLEKLAENKKLKSIVMDGVRSGKEDQVKNVVMDEVKSEKVGKLENCKMDTQMWSRSEERLCKAIIKGQARNNREKYAMLADVEGGGTRTRRHML